MSVATWSLRERPVCRRCRRRRRARQAFFDVEMHVFEVERPFEGAGLDFADDLRHAALDVGEVFRRDDGLFGEHAACANEPRCPAPHAFVESRPSRVAFDEVGHRLGKTASPGVLCRIRLIHDGCKFDGWNFGGVGAAAVMANGPKPRRKAFLAPMNKA